VWRITSIASSSSSKVNRTAFVAAFSKTNWESGRRRSCVSPKWLWRKSASNERARAAGSITLGSSKRFLELEGAKLWIEASEAQEELAVHRYAHEVSPSFPGISSLRVVLQVFDLATNPSRQETYGSGDRVHVLRTTASKVVFFPAAAPIRASLRARIRAGSLELQLPAFVQ
jgi:hypothetical protein